MNIIAVDPGGTTGFCYAKIINLPIFGEAKCFVQPFQLPDDVDNFWRRLEEFKPRYIVMEDFEFRQKARAGLNLFPVQLIGVARLYELMVPKDREATLYLQKASQGKSYYKDELLKKYGFYKRGVPHGMDALRHLLQWFTFGAGYQFLGNDKIENFIQITDTWN